MHKRTTSSYTGRGRGRGRGGGVEEEARTGKVGKDGIGMGLGGWAVAGAAEGSALWSRGASDPCHHRERWRAACMRWMRSPHGNCGMSGNSSERSFMESKRPTVSQEGLGSPV